MISFLEEIANKLKLYTVIGRSSRFRNMVKPIYMMIMKMIYTKGLPRKIGKLEKIYISHKCLFIGVIPAAHEIKWWEELLEEVRQGDVIVEVGAYVGLLTTLLAKKTGKTGRVIAFEPNMKSSVLLREHIKLNGASGQVELSDYAISDSAGPMLLSDENSYSHLSHSSESGCGNFLNVRTISLDEILKDVKIDILKIDIEGYEFIALSGAKKLLSRKEGYPRFIFIECHPYEWGKYGTDGKDLVGLLKEAGYHITMPGSPHNGFSDLKNHCAIFASREAGDVPQDNGAMLEGAGLGLRRDPRMKK